MTTPTITRYRDYLQHSCGRKPATVNRPLISIKRYGAWAVEGGQIPRNPGQGVKMVGEEAPGTHHSSDTDEAALIKAVTAAGSLRDQTLRVLLLHTGLRVHEVGPLKHDDLLVAVYRSMASAINIARCP